MRYSRATTALWHNTPPVSVTTAEVGGEGEGDGELGETQP
jgi:hypothetical protein